MEEEHESVMQEMLRRNVDCKWYFKEMYADQSRHVCSYDLWKRQPENQLWFNSQKSMVIAFLGR